jgi:hypothetical protein
VHHSQDGGRNDVQQSRDDCAHGGVIDLMSSVVDRHELLTCREL